MKKLLILFILGLLFINANTQLCSYTATKAALSDFAKLITDLKNAVVYEDMDFLAAVARVLTKTGEVVLKTLGCALHVAAMAPLGDVVRQRYDNFCYYKPEDSQWAKDPCCNPALQETQCCAYRKVNVTMKGITKFNDLALSTCNNPEKIKNLLKAVLGEHEVRQQLCYNVMKQKLAKYADVVTQMYRCVQDVYLTPKDCASHSDCFSGFCDPTTDKCAGIGLDANSTAIVNCITHNLPDEVVKYLKLKLKLRGSDTVEKLRQKFSEFLLKEGCLSPDGAIVPAASKEICELSKICNDGTSAITCNTGTSFCAGGCKANGQCTPFPAFTDPATCEARGFCFGHKVNPSYTKEECESHSRCTDPRCDATAGCTQQECEKTGRCIGFPFSRNTCVSPFRYKSGDDVRTCPGGESETSIFGCIENGFITEQNCLAAGYKWIKVPQTEAECTGLKFCREGYRFTFKSEESCNKCNGKYESVFKWIPAKWVKSVFIPVFKWKERQVIPNNRWRTVLDPVRLVYFAYRLLTFQFLPLFGTFAHCAYSPYLRLIKEVACDCGTDKGTDCFKDIETIVATFRAFAESSQRFEFVDATIDATNAISVEKDNVDITVSTTFAVKTQIASKAQLGSVKNSNIITDNEVAYIKDSGNRNVGQLVSDGVRLSVEGGATLEKPVKLCIKRQQDIPIVDSSYKVPVFAILKDDKYVATQIDATNKDTLEIEGCAEVKDGQTYYYGFIQEGAERSAAGVLSSSLMVMLFCLSVYLLFM